MSYLADKTLLYATKKCHKDADIGHSIFGDTYGVSALHIHLRLCIHRLFPCDLFPCTAVTRSDDGGRDRTTSQQHYDSIAN